MIDPFSPPQGASDPSESNGLLEVVRRGFIAFDVLAAGYVLFALTNAVQMGAIKGGDPGVVLAVAMFFGGVVGGLLGSAWGLYRRKRWAWVTQSLLTLGCFVLVAGILYVLRAF